MTTGTVLFLYCSWWLVLTLSMLDSLSCFFCRLLTFFQNQHFQKILSGTLWECQTVSIHIRTDVKLCQSWSGSKTVCKGYKQTTKTTASRLRVNIYWNISNTGYGTMSQQGRSVNYYPVLSANTLLSFIMTVALIYKISSTRQQIITLKAPITTVVDNKI